MNRARRDRTDRIKLSETGKDNVASSSPVHSGLNQALLHYRRGKPRTWAALTYNCTRNDTDLEITAPE